VIADERKAMNSLEVRIVDCKGVTVLLQFSLGGAIRHDANQLDVDESCDAVNGFGADDAGQFAGLGERRSFAEPGGIAVECGLADAVRGDMEMQHDVA